MATDIVVPALGESVTEATVAQWLKQPGDAVAVDEPIVELETDKVTLEVNASVAGVLLEVIAAAGANVEVGALLGRIGDGAGARSEEHTSELQSLMRISYAVFCLKKKKIKIENNKSSIKQTKIWHRARIEKT